MTYHFTLTMTNDDTGETREYRTEGQTDPATANPLRAFERMIWHVLKTLQTQTVEVEAYYPGCQVDFWGDPWENIPLLFFDDEDQGKREVERLIELYFGETHPPIDWQHDEWENPRHWWLHDNAYGVWVDDGSSADLEAAENELAKRRTDRRGCTHG